MKKDAQILKRKSADDFTAGIPNKRNPKDSLVNKAYSLGYQQAALINGMQSLAKQQVDQQQQYAQAVQQLFQLQAQLAQQQSQAPVMSMPSMGALGGAMPPGAGAPAAPAPMGMAPAPAPAPAPPMGAGAPQPPMM